MSNMGVSKNRWYPQIIHFNRVFPYKPSILGWKPQFLETTKCQMNLCRLSAGQAQAFHCPKQWDASNLKLQLEKYHTNPYICILYTVKTSIEYHTSTMQWNSMKFKYTYSTLHYNWKVPRSKHISFFCTGWSTSRIIKDHLKSLRRTALSPSLQSIRSSCAVARNSAVALDKACLKKNTLVSGTEDLEVSVQDSLIRVFVKWVLTKHVYWKKSWYGWILRISCSSPKPPTPYSHTANSIHFATCQIPENVSIFRFQSETERHESIQESWKGWPGKPPKPPAAERFEFRMSHAPCIPSSEPHWTWTTWTTVKTTNLIQFVKLHSTNGVKIEPKSQNCNAQCPLNMKGHRVRVHCNAQPPAQASLAQSKQPGN